MAPALQEVFGDFAAFCQYSRVSGLFMQYFQDTAGPDGFRERGSKRLNDLIGPVTFPECPGSWLTCAASSLHSSCISWQPYRAKHPQGPFCPHLIPSAQPSDSFGIPNFVKV